MSVRQIFDGNSTTSQVLHGRDLTGKVILITRATAGLGFESALSLSKHGAEIVLCGRSENTCRTAENKILEVVSDAKIFTVPMELSCLASVKQGANIIKNKYKSIDILILNARVSIIGYSQTTDGLESVFQINHLAHFYLTLLLEDLLLPGSRVVSVSSFAHRCSFLNQDNISEERLNPTSDSQYYDLFHETLKKNTNDCFVKRN